MSRFTEAQAALDSRLGTLASSPPVAWENVSYEPTEGTTYLRPSNLPAGHTAIGIANTDGIRGAGIYQVDVFAPRNEGPGVALGIADNVADLFTRGLKLTSGDTQVIVGVPTQDPAEPSGAWFRVAVLIPYDTLYRS